MAREEGRGGGAFGWTLLGILVGVAGTLAVETLLSNEQARQVHDEQAASSANLVVAAAPEPAPRKAIMKTPAVVARKSEAAPPPQDDVEDDAAAAGMTSRSHPGETEDQSSLAGAAN